MVLCAEEKICKVTKILVSSLWSFAKMKDAINLFGLTISKKHRNDTAKKFLSIILRFVNIR